MFSFCPVFGSSVDPDGNVEDDMYFVCPDVSADLLGILHEKVLILNWSLIFFEDLS